MKNIEKNKKIKRAAILIDDNFHIHEAYYPYFRLKEAGIETLFVAEEAGKVYYDYNGEPLESHISVNAASKQIFDLIHCPGGFAPMKLRANNNILNMAKNHFNSGRLFTAICHAGSFLVSMDVLKGRKVTSYKTLKDDIINAGAIYIDEAPIVDNNLITARTPNDLPQFLEAIVRYLKEGPDSTKKIPDSLPLEKISVGIFVDNRYQANQVWYLYYRFKSLGTKVSFIGNKRGEVYNSRVSKIEVKCDISVNNLLDRKMNVLVVPGDWSADKMRINQSILKLVNQHIVNNGLLISIGEGHTVLISAKILKNIRVAGLPEMQKEILNSGAMYFDQPALLNNNIITLRDTNDLPELMAMVKDYFNEK
jgi:protease I